MMRWGFWSQKRREKDLDEEIRAHLEIEARDRKDSGELEADASARARR